MPDHHRVRPEDQIRRQCGAACLKEFARRNQERNAVLERVREEAQWIGDSVQVCEWLALEFGIRASQSAGDWADWAAEQLNAPVAEWGSPGRCPTRRGVRTLLSRSSMVPTGPWQRADGVPVGVRGCDAGGSVHE
ncbi:hypothetical protein OG455_20230 [Kitasatospora sp. NBC_01287]|uniref:hypothetical protein n=1 Tax=Kitasatospora sp. NBC_01287 TaxID=2903573 RepID=UPI002256E63C|nr:hypothetical protein [Kitasatospora sp. NBC_01287]MCX4747817.1 hypothetical protein [Kitasatospora sp. NBC_01287]